MNTEPYQPPPIRLFSLMTSQQGYSLLALVDLLGLLITIWLDIVPVPVGMVMFMMVVIALLDLMRGVKLTDLFGI